MHKRTYGTQGPAVFVLHGGPGAAGNMAPVARGLADTFRVIEPYQRGSSDAPLTVARHIADLYDEVSSCDEPRPALVGSSWGAMLALAYAAARPARSGPIVLIGCGTFDHAARERMHVICAERTNEDLRKRLEDLQQEIPDPNQRLGAMGSALLPIYAHDLVTTDLEFESFDARAHHETWNDMLRLQDEGLYPAAFAAITAPVLMLHGALDPHPGRMIQASLTPHIPQLEYHEWPHCGHYPWLEKSTRDDFFHTLCTWLTEYLD